MYPWLNAKPIWRRYLAYARSTLIWDAVSPANETSRLNPSASTSPTMSASNVDWSSACRTPTSVPAGTRTPMS